MRNCAFLFVPLLGIAAPLLAQQTRSGEPVNSSVDQVGVRRERETIAPTVQPLKRLNSRVQGRLQSRIQNRLDRSFSEQRHPESRFEASEKPSESKKEVPLSVVTQAGSR